jgi:hypothetical protein
VPRTLQDLFLAYRQAKAAVYAEQRGTGLAEFASYEASLHTNLHRLHRRLAKQDTWFENTSPGSVWVSPKRSIEELAHDHLVYIGTRPLPRRRDLEVRMMLTPSIDFLITEVLFLWEFGPVLDGLLSESSLGNRLDVRHNAISHTRAGLFQYWRPRYASFRADPIRVAREMLSRAANAGCVVVSLDFAAYYDNVDARFLVTKQFLVEVERVTDRNYSANFKSAASSLLAAYRAYHRDVSFLTGARVSRGIPIGALTSRLVANLALLPLDRILNSAPDVRCYRRYVDDVFIVSERDERASTDVDMLRRWLPVQVTPKGAAEIRLDSAALERSGTELSLQSRKLGIYDLAGPTGLDFLSAVAADVKRIASERRALVDRARLRPDKLASTVLEGPAQRVGVRVLRKQDRMTLGNMEASITLTMLQNIALFVERREATGVIRRAVSQLITFLVNSAEWVEQVELVHRLLRIVLLAHDWVSTDKLIRHTEESFGTTAALDQRIENLVWNGRVIRRDRSLLRLRDFLHRRRAEAVYCSLPVSAGSSLPPLAIRVGVRLLLHTQLRAGARSFASADLRTFDREDDQPFIGPYNATNHEALRGELVEFDELRERFEEIQRFRDLCDRLGGSECWLVDPVALFLSTRPPSYFDVARRWFADGETRDLEPDLFDRVQALVNALRGTSYFQSMGYVGEERTIHLVLQNAETPPRARIILGNLVTRSDWWARSVAVSPASPRGLPVLSFERYVQLNDVLKYAADASRAGGRKARPPSLLVLPELSIPRAWIRGIAHHVSRLRAYSLVTGLEYHHDPLRRQVQNQVLGVFLGPWHTVATWLWNKGNPADGERAELRSRGLTFPPYHQRHRRTVVDTDFGRLSVLVCSELIEARLVSQLVGRVEIALVPSWNRDTASYEHLVQSAGLQIHGIIAIANNGHYSDCRAWAPYEERWQRDLCRLIERDVNDVIWVDVPVAGLRHFHESGVGDEWRPLPPGWKNE